MIAKIFLSITVSLTLHLFLATKQFLLDFGKTITLLNSGLLKGDDGNFYATGTIINDDSHLRITAFVSTKGSLLSNCKCDLFL